MNLYIWKECTAGAVINACNEVAIQDAAGVDVRQDAVRDERTKTEDRKLLIQIMLLFEKKGKPAHYNNQSLWDRVQKSYSLGQLDAECLHMEKLRRMCEKGFARPGIVFVAAKTKTDLHAFPVYQSR